jgi:hypothetical protein
MHMYIVVSTKGERRLRSSHLTGFGSAECNNEISNCTSSLIMSSGAVEIKIVFAKLFIHDVL